MTAGSKRGRKWARQPAAAAAEMPLLDHLAELRTLLLRSCGILMIGVCVGFVFYEAVVELLMRPFAALPFIQDDQQLYINSILEGFTVKIKLSFFVGFILTFPVQLVLFLRFLFPALEPKEKKFLLYAILSSSVLILLSVYYSYGKILPLSIRFLTGSGFLPANVGILLGYKGNVFFVFQFVIAMLILFQFPVVLELLMFLKLLRRQTLVRGARFFIVGIVVLAALITPPDPISLVSVALPLIGLFYVTLFIAKIFNFGK